MYGLLGYSSSIFAQTSRVSQGSVLDPPFLILYIDDIVLHPDVQYFLYANIINLVFVKSTPLENLSTASVENTKKYRLENNEVYLGKLGKIV